MYVGRWRWGTSSWSEASWVGPFYPPGTAPADFLRAYATRFDTVEADVTYYRVPAARMVAGWAGKLPDGFRLAAKFPRSVVHCGEGARPDPARLLVPEHVGGEAELFLERMAGLGAKCGPLVLQFPYFNKLAFTSRAPFLERLADFLSGLPAHFRYAVELRNRTWIDAELLALLSSRRVALVWVDLAYMPHPSLLGTCAELLTTDFAYVRLIGDRKDLEARTQTFDRIVVDQAPRLERWARWLRESPGDVPEAYVYANNHYAGHAPATIRELARLVQ
jgi:uncharacterized protein YecE (DUF72 family)